MSYSVGSMYGGGNCGSSWTNHRENSIILQQDLEESEEQSEVQKAGIDRPKDKKRQQQTNKQKQQQRENYKCKLHFIVSFPRSLRAMHYFYAF